MNYCEKWGKTMSRKHVKWAKIGRSEWKIRCRTEIRAGPKDKPIIIFIHCIQGCNSKTMVFIQ